MVVVSTSRLSMVDSSLLSTAGVVVGGNTSPLSVTSRLSAAVVGSAGPPVEEGRVSTLFCSEEDFSVPLSVAGVELSADSDLVSVEAPSAARCSLDFSSLDLCSAPANSLIGNMDGSWVLSERDAPKWVSNAEVFVGPLFVPLVTLVEEVFNVGVVSSLEESVVSSSDEDPSVVVEAGESGVVVGVPDGGGVIVAVELELFFVLGNAASPKNLMMSSPAMPAVCLAWFLCIISVATVVVVTGSLLKNL